MKNLTIMVLVFALISVGQVSSNFAQNTTDKNAKQNEKAAKQAEKVHKAVRKLGIGDLAVVKVTLFDDKQYAGHIGESNVSSFTVIDKSGASTSINYSNVKAIEGRNSSSGAKTALYIGIGAGAVLVTFLIWYLNERGVCRGCN